jgi:acid phosphatase (class A)
MKISFLLLLLSFSVTVLGQQLSYLRPDSIDLERIPAPPLEGTQADREDLATVLHWQAMRTELECTRAHHESHGFADSFFGPPYGPLSQDEAARLIDFQERLFKEVNFFSRILKQRYSRQRPADRDLSLRPCIPSHASNAYPSGHAAIAHVAAQSFALIHPEHARALLRRAEEVALGRVIGGVHHPLDIVAGKQLGELIYEALVLSPDFMDDLMALSP